MKMFLLVSLALLVKITVAAPCSLIDCRWGSCQEINGNGRCVCPDVCTAQADPRCGTDGVTYGNPCQLNIATCRSQGNITERHAGACGSPTATTRAPTLTCASVLCITGSFCRMVNGQPRCLCSNDVCSENWDPRCGSDGKTYGNACKMAAKICNSSGQVFERHVGECQTLTCANILCIIGSTCQMIGGSPRCICNTACTREFDPRCGSDGVTYSNGCLMNAKTCNSSGAVTEVHAGACVESTTVPVQCQTVRCGRGATCQVVNGRARCVCNEACTFEFNPVCGTDGETYPNNCVLEAKFCTSEGRVSKAHDGECVTGGSTRPISCSVNDWISHESAWNIRKRDSYEATFSVSGLDGTPSLKEVINFNGGNTKNKFLKESVAALLNSVKSGFTYQYTRAQVIAKVKASVWDNTKMSNAYAEFQSANSGRCPL